MAINEGKEAFTLRPDDVWAVLTVEDERIVLQQGEPGPIRIQPHESTIVQLLPPPNGPERAIAALTYRSAAFGLEVHVATAYVPPTPRLVMPAVYDVELVRAKVHELMNLSTWVGPDGRVKQVFDPASATPTAAPGLLEAARRALKEWEFSPATEDGVPAAALHQATFVFGGPSAFRAVFDMPTAELLARLPQLLEASFATVVPLPSARGFVAADRPREEKGLARVRVFLIQVGEEPGTGRTWVAVRQELRVRQSKGSACGCAWWSGEERDAPELLKWMANKLGVGSAGHSALTLGGGSRIPSGLLEPTETAGWERGPIGRLVDHREEKARRGTGGTALLPDESEILHGPPTSGPQIVEGHITPPRLLQKVRPKYPEKLRMARQEGHVILQAVIDQQGNIGDVTVLRSTLTAFEPAAVEAVCCWKYAPATLDGRPVDVYFTVVVEFFLK